MPETRGETDKPNRNVKLVAYADERIALIEHLGSISGQAYRTQEYIGLACLGGRATININNTVYEVEAGDYIFCHPNMILENSMFTADFQFKGIVLTQKFVKEFEVYITDGWDVLVTMDSQCVVKMSEKEMKIFLSYWELFKEKLTGDLPKHRKEIVTCLLMAMIYEFRDTTERFLNAKRLPLTSSGNLYKRFMQMLTSSFPKRREVSYYAAQLCVTPKYLSSVCKATCGETASEIIAKHVIKDIKFMLRKRDLSIKEAAIQLGFDNLSFFGKYVKRALGVSPKAYRQAPRNGQ